MPTSASPWHSRDLRHGRYSEPHHLYHIVATTFERKPLFADLIPARHVIRALMGAEQLGRARTWAFVLMPDHLHWLLELDDAQSLHKVVGAVKSVSAHGLGGKVWQQGYFDRALRAEEDARAVARYIVANPLRKGLVEEIGQYPHWDAMWM